MCSSWMDYIVRVDKNVSYDATATAWVYYRKNHIQISACCLLRPPPNIALLSTTNVPAPDIPMLAAGRRALVPDGIVNLSATQLIAVSRAHWVTVGGVMREIAHVHITMRAIHENELDTDIELFQASTDRDKKRRKHPEAAIVPQALFVSMCDTDRIAAIVDHVPEAPPRPVRRGSAGDRAENSADVGPDAGASHTASTTGATGSASPQRPQAQASGGSQQHHDDVETETSVCVPSTAIDSIGKDHMLKLLQERRESAVAKLERLQLKRATQNNARVHSKSNPSQKYVNFIITFWAKLKPAPADANTSGTAAASTGGGAAATARGGLDALGDVTAGGDNVVLYTAVSPPVIVRGACPEKFRRAKNVESLTTAGRRVAPSLGSRNLRWEKCGDVDEQ